MKWPIVTYTALPPNAVCVRKDLHMRKLWLSVLFGLAAAVAPTVGASADPGTRSKHQAIEGRGAGLVTVAPTGHDVAGRFTVTVK
jgi:hypothetical protein